ncbi:hypothetical protein [Methylobacterium sp. Leaf99]|jgi:hypothetical protein|uniref:hypothetical protein n=1 Tax=Methylobacterium sp. Leaf99 TaxID=1736251 RepID=UPI0012EEE04B|nr:hypothetical protein [Methylobacterium sp. Leaf99]
MSTRQTSDEPSVLSATSADTIVDHALAEPFNGVAQLLLFEILTHADEAGRVASPKRATYRPALIAQVDTGDVVQSAHHTSEGAHLAARSPSRAPPVAIRLAASVSCLWSGVVFLRDRLCRQAADRASVPAYPSTLNGCR